MCIANNLVHHEYAALYPQFTFMPTMTTSSALITKTTDSRMQVGGSLRPRPTRAFYGLCKMMQDKVVPTNKLVCNNVLWSNKPHNRRMHLMHKLRKRRGHLDSRWSLHLLRGSGECTTESYVHAYECKPHVCPVHPMFNLPSTHTTLNAVISLGNVANSNYTTLTLLHFF